MANLSFYEIAGLLCGSAFMHYVSSGGFQFFSIVGGATTGAIILVAFKVYRNRVDVRLDAPET